MLNKYSNVIIPKSLKFLVRREDVRAIRKGWRHNREKLVSN